MSRGCNEICLHVDVVIASGNWCLLPGPPRGTRDLCLCLLLLRLVVLITVSTVRRKHPLHAFRGVLSRKTTLPLRPHPTWANSSVSICHHVGFFEWCVGTKKKTPASAQTVTQSPSNDFQRLLSRPTLRGKFYKGCCNTKDLLLQWVNISLHLHWAFEPAEL